MFNLGRINPQDPLSYSLQLEYIILNMLFYSQNLPANTMYLIPKCWSWAWSLACHGTSQWWVFNKFLKYCKCPAVLRSYVTPCNVSCKLSCNADDSKNQPKQKQTMLESAQRKRLCCSLPFSTVLIFFTADPNPILFGEVGEGGGGGGGNGDIHACVSRLFYLLEGQKNCRDIIHTRGISMWNFSGFWQTLMEPFNLHIGLFDWIFNCSMMNCSSYRLHNTPIHSKCACVTGLWWVHFLMNCSQIHSVHFMLKEVCVQIWNEAFWIRLQIEDSARKPSSGTATILVHYPHSPYFIAAGMRTTHKNYIFQVMFNIVIEYMVSPSGSQWLAQQITVGHSISTFVYTVELEYHCLYQRPWWMRCPVLERRKSNCLGKMYYPWPIWCSTNQVR